MRCLNKDVALAVVSGRQQRVETAAARASALAARTADAHRLAAENLALRRRWALARTALLALRVAPTVGPPLISDSSDSESTELASSETTFSRKDPGELFEAPLYPCLDESNLLASSDDRWAKISTSLSSALFSVSDTYQAAFINSYRWLLTGPGPLNHALRLNLAIIGIAESGNRSAAIDLAEAWVSSGGSGDWLRNPSTSPTVAFTKLSAALIQRPPRVRPEHFRELECGGWSPAEIAQALLILAHFQSMPLLLLSTADPFNEEVNDWEEEEDEGLDLNESCQTILTPEEYCWEDAESLMEALLEGTRVLTARRDSAPCRQLLSTTVLDLYGYRTAVVSPSVGGNVGGSDVEASERLFRRAVICPSTLSSHEIERMRAIFSTTDWVAVWEARVEVAVVVGFRYLAESLLAPVAQ